MADVVLVDDDDLYREALSADLADRGFAVSSFANAPSFLEALSDGMQAQVALLDWVLPTMSGFELLNTLRQRGIELPVIFLTGYAMIERELQALNRGAADFVDKARGTDVLVHRLRVIIESQRPLPLSTTLDTEVHGDLTLYPVSERALWQLQDVGLTLTEYKILVRLVSHKGALQSYRAIYDTAHYEGFIAGSGERGYSTNVRSLIKRMRRKFLAVDSSFRQIENKQGVGYRWRQPKA